jgi:nucleotide-binding universal stress UspA family protein
MSALTSVAVLYERSRLGDDALKLACEWFPRSAMTIVGTWEPLELQAAKSTAFMPPFDAAELDEEAREQLQAELAEAVATAGSAGVQAQAQVERIETSREAALVAACEHVGPGLIVVGVSELPRLRWTCPVLTVPDLQPGAKPRSRRWAITPVLRARLAPAHGSVGA